VTAEGQSVTDDRFTRVSLFGVMTTILQYSRALLVIGAAGFLIGGLLPIIRPKYVAQSSFVPEGSTSSMANLVGLAAQFGVTVPGAGNDESIEFYVRLVRSREVLQGIALTEFAFSKGKPGEPAPDSLRGNLVLLYGFTGKNPHKNLLGAINKLDDNIGIQADTRAGMISLRTKARYADLAALLNRRTLDLINEFNLRRRQSQAGEERRFIEARMDQAQRELQTSENELARFLERNRRYLDSPQLAFEASRLERRLDLRQQVYTTLAQAYEQARISEVRNTPVITIIDVPEGSEKRAGGVVIGSLVGLLVGLMLGTFVAVALESLVAQKRADPEAYASLRNIMLATPVVGPAARFWLRVR